MGTDYDRTLAAKYDEIYRNDPFCKGVKPSQVEGWPSDRYQALVYLARPGGRLLEIGCGRGKVLLALAPRVAFLPQRLRLLLGRAPTTHTGGPDEGFDADPRRTILHNGGHLHYLGFRQVETLYRLGGFRPERRLGFCSRLGRLSDYWPTLLSSSVCVSGTFQGSDSQSDR